jgi:hypothetical protein
VPKVSILLCEAYKESVVVNNESSIFLRGPHTGASTLFRKLVPQSGAANWCRKLVPHTGVANWCRTLVPLRLQKEEQSLTCMYLDS